MRKATFVKSFNVKVIYLNLFPQDLTRCSLKLDALDVQMHAITGGACTNIVGYRANVQCMGSSEDM
jgi:hypothetical protein